MKFYRAPWSTLLIAISGVATVFCLVIPLVVYLSAGAQHKTVALWMLLLPLLALTCAMFVVRGYTVTPDAILVHRSFCETAIPRADLQSAQVEPHAMRWSLRTFGNGGFFSITGWYWNRKLGAYRAFVTDPSHPVVLKYPQRTILLSPETPEDFVREISNG